MKETHAILLVEDNPADIQITRRALRDSNLPVELIVVRDGQEAIDYLLRQGSHSANVNWRKPDLILLDVVMPDMDGMETCRLLRAMDATKLTPIIMVTTRGEEKTKVSAHINGATDFVTKPINQKELVDKITRHLGVRA